MVQKYLAQCDNETMSEIDAIWFDANTRKFENFWIFDLACGQGPRKFENRKLTDLCENVHFFCENLQIFGKCCTFFLRKFADFYENLQLFSKIYRFLRNFANVCENLQIFAKRVIFFAKICRFL